MNSEKSTVSANELIGSWVYSSVSNEKVGEIEDFIVSLNGSDHNIILGHGGFLGLGEKRVKISIDDLRMRPSDERIYVAMSDNELKQATGLEKRDGNWTAKPAETGSGYGNMNRERRGEQSQ